jgi:putative oxidoreductase
MLRSTHRRIPLALLFLRLSVFLVMLMWTLDKFVNPDHAAAVFETFYFIGGLNNILMYVIGVAQLVVIIGFVIGFKKRVTYLIVLFLHAASTLSAFKQYFAPYEDTNLLFFAAWPMLAACFALYYLHDWDTLWVIDKEKARLF